jgi:two-component system cell cycle sensor histidine kinase/response regulator CckA
MLAPDRPTVLIVEDDEGIAELERRRLEESGYGARVATTPAAGLAELARGDIDLVLLDYRLPGGVDGLEFYERMKAAGYDLPVVLVTAYSNEATVIRALRAGVRDFVTKSLDYMDYLPEAVGHVLRQVRTENQLAESEARLSAIIQSADAAVVIVEADGRVSLFNPAAERMFGCPAAAAAGRPLDDFLPPARAGQPVGDRPAGRRADGQTFPVETSVALTSAGGRSFCTLMVRDVTEQKRAADRLKEQARLLDRARDAILVIDLAGTVRYWNRGAEQLYGWSPAEAVGRPITTLLAATDPGPRQAALEAVQAADEWAGELAHVTRTGKALAVQSHWTLARDEAGQPAAILQIDTDVTERRRLEEQLRQSQKMEAIGVLAGGVAHDFNNLLTVIQGYGEMVLQDTGLSADVRDLVGEIHRAGDQAASLTRQLLAFSRKQVLAPRVLDVNGVVRETERMLRRLIGEDIEFVTALDPTLGPVRADPGQLEQVVMNLVANARDAMKHGGRLTIATRNAEITPGDGGREGLTAGRYILMTVADSGTGMDEATRTRIFEPFFTTKGPGKGTGLGLSTVHGIVRQSGGHLDVTSELGKGTTFHIYLPRHAEKGARPDASGLAAGIPRGTETILLADDDPGVRGLARMALEGCGYKVLEAGDGEAAYKAGAGYPGPVDLLVTDVVMPRLSGREVADRLVELRPGLKVLYVSGYTDDAVVRTGVYQAKVAFLQKPFTPTTLGRKVREVLDN